MASIQRHCYNHPGRRAIGVCVVTSNPICAECSTRYEGVNYSREGLEQLKARRAAASAATGRERVVSVAMVLLSPVLLGGLFVFYWLALRLMIDMLQMEVV
ncbi:hypothetical protein ACERK3_16545 [Phycisphaerales bacterium AB-hyl4]|uniref:Uncharacterized protein n=1 Tax=Natronomicrosphaera hydrolytica TaxID=3242702 RepID=A0ABV4UAJ8_9BACT